MHGLPLQSCARSRAPVLRSCASPRAEILAALTAGRAAADSGRGEHGRMADAYFAIETRGLVKRFGKTTALAGVDLAARPGTVLGILGPNGAGKTTAVRILATLLRPDD